MVGTEKRRPRKLSEAVVKFGLSYVRYYLKERSHRRPSDKKVRDAFLRWCNSSSFLQFIARTQDDLFRRLEEFLGKPPKNWTTNERQLADEIITAYFDDLRHLFERTSGRPKSREGRGILGREIAKSYAEQKQFTRESIRELKRTLPSFVRGAKLGAFANREEAAYLRDGHSKSQAENRFGTPKAVQKYIQDAGIDSEEVERSITDAEAVRLFINKSHLDSRLERALRQHLTRAKNHL